MTLMVFLAVTGFAMAGVGVFVDATYGNGLIPLVTLLLGIRYATGPREVAVYVAALSGALLLTAASGALRLATFATGASMILTGEAAGRLCRAVTNPAKELPHGR